jgi:hypothetical protein
MTNKHKIWLLLALSVLWIAFGASWLMEHGDEGVGFQVYTAGGLILWVAAFVHVLNQIQVSKMSPAEYAQYKIRLRPESLM